MKKLNRAGYTVLELLVSIAIVLIVMAAAITLEVSYKRSFVLGTTYLGIHTYLRGAMDYMVKDMRWGSERVASYGGYTSAGNCAVIKVPSIGVVDSVPNEVIEGSYDYFVYKLNGTDLQRIVIATGSSTRTSGTRVIAKDITGLTFSVSGTGENITIAITSLKSVASLGGANKNVSETLNATVKFRNKS